MATEQENKKRNHIISIDYEINRHGLTQERFKILKSFIEDPEYNLCSTVWNKIFEAINQCLYKNVSSVVNDLLALFSGESENQEKIEKIIRKLF